MLPPTPGGDYKSKVAASFSNSHARKFRRRPRARAVISISVAMKLTRGQDAFDRYNIVHDIAAAVERVHLGHRLSHKAEAESGDAESR